MEYFSEDLLLLLKLQNKANWNKIISEYRIPNDIYNKYKTSIICCLQNNLDLFKMKQFLLDYQNDLDIISFFKDIRISTAKVPHELLECKIYREIILWRAYELYNPPLSTEEIEMYIKDINFDFCCLYNTTEDLINKYPQYINYYILSCRRDLSISLFKKYFKKLNLSLVMTTAKDYNPKLYRVAKYYLRYHLKSLNKKRC